MCNALHFNDGIHKLSLSLSLSLSPHNSSICCQNYFNCIWQLKSTGLFRRFKYPKVNTRIKDWVSHCLRRWVDWDYIMMLIRWPTVNRLINNNMLLDCTVTNPSGMLINDTCTCVAVIPSKLDSTCTHLIMTNRSYLCFMTKRMDTIMCNTNNTYTW